MNESGNGFADTGFNGDITDLVPDQTNSAEDKQDTETEVSPEDSASQTDGAGKPPKKIRWWDGDKCKRIAKDKMVTAQSSAKATTEALIDKMRGTLEAYICMYIYIYCQVVEVVVVSVVGKQGVYIYIYILYMCMSTYSEFT